MAKGGSLVQIGTFRKTRRPDMLSGTIEIADLNLKLRVLAFIKTAEQKRNKNDPDLVLLLPTDGKPSGEVPEDVFG